MVEFKDLVYNRRKELGISMEVLGKKVGVSKATIQRWESGEISNVRRDKIAKLASALDTTPAYLMGWDEKQLFPGNLRTLMQNNKINANELSAKSGISVERIIEFLDHKDDPTKREADILSEYFGVSFEDLLTKNLTVDQSYDKKTEVIIELVSHLNDVGKDRVIAYIQDLSVKYGTDV